MLATTAKIGEHKIGASFGKIYLLGLMYTEYLSNSVSPESTKKRKKT